MDLQIADEEGALALVLAEKLNDLSPILELKAARERGAAELRRRIFDLLPEDEAKILAGPPPVRSWVFRDTSRRELGRIAGDEFSPPSKWPAGATQAAYEILSAEGEE